MNSLMGEFLIDIVGKPKGLMSTVTDDPEDDGEDITGDTMPTNIIEELKKPYGYTTSTFYTEDIPEFRVTLTNA